MCAAPHVHPTWGCCHWLRGVMWLHAVSPPWSHKEDVQFLRQRGVSVNHCEVVGFVAGDVLHPLPHPPCVVAADMFLYPPLLCCLGLSDASPQDDSGSTVLCPFTAPKGLVSLLQQGPDLSSHPWLLIWIDPDALLDGYSFRAELAEFCTLTGWYYFLPVGMCAVVLAGWNIEGSLGWLGLGVYFKPNRPQWMRILLEF